jgi:hypothetical protein
MCPAKTCKNALQYRLLADDQMLDPVALLDADGPIAEFGLEIALPEIGWFQNM